MKQLPLSFKKQKVKGKVNLKYTPWAIEQFQSQAQEQRMIQYQEALYDVRMQQCTINECQRVERSSMLSRFSHYVRWPR